MTEAAVQTGDKAEAPTSLWRSSKVQIGVFLLLYILLRLPWVFTLPLTEAPDEGNHFWVCQFLTTHLRLPTGQEVLVGSPGTELEFAL